MLPALLAGSAKAETALPKGREYIFLCDSFEKGLLHVQKYKTKHVRPGVIKALDVAANEVTTMDVPFFGHMVDQHPLNPKHLITFEKWGEGGAVIDFEAKKILTHIVPHKGYEFFGHAVLNSDGSKIADTEFSFDETHGILAIRNTSDMKVIDTYQSYGVRPHECFSHDGGKTMIVVNAGHHDGTPNISWIDYATGKLVRQIDIGKAPDVFYMHASLSHDGWLSICGRGNPKSRKHGFDLVLFISPDGRVCPPHVPNDIRKKMMGEALSIAYLGQSGLVGITLPDANMALIMNYKTQELVEAIPLRRPKGILMDTGADGTTILVSTTKPRDMVATRIEEGTQSQTKTLKPGMGGLGSHYTRLYI